jgi:hypothetical protein
MTVMAAGWRDMIPERSKWTIPVIKQNQLKPLSTGCSRLSSSQVLEASPSEHKYLQDY